MTARDEIFAHLTQVQDPEVPVLNVVEMGIVRDVELVADSVQVVITPTYSGCPAMHVIEQRIVQTLAEKGYKNVSVKTSFAEAWTTDWMTDEARSKLKQYGIAPPLRGSQGEVAPAGVECPSCESGDTELRAEFGSTACKSLYFCNDCRQPFEHFKCL
jgi:ring-1,2-phenylacetyl-CoA epoxidase subunit PaaD